ncbi:MAG: valine--tRNA ligase [Pseudomonadota bacterium]
MLEKRYQPADFERQIYQEWEQRGYFKPKMKRELKPFSIVIPPPNITGNLHMGHALNNMIQDLLIRAKRMQGFDVLWQPGTDHASIATQMVVERQLKEQNLPSRREMGREKFLQKVWEWKETANNNITNQLRRLGASCDWSRERFTMDEGLSKAVIESFVQFYKAGFIYRDKRLLNWDPKMETAISDLEVVQKETESTIWSFSYPIKDTPDQTITVATTRPETMLGDSAVAVHGDDARYQHLIGKICTHPITKRDLLIVADEIADPELGTGAVKITPAHDFNDFQTAKRHNLEMIEIFDKRACLNSNVPQRYQHLDRFEARTKIIAEMKSLGFYAGEEQIIHSVPYSERGNVPVEPMLSDQWFVDCKKMAQLAVEAVRKGETHFVPSNWQNTFFDWLENIEPWCISRQLWWGHQIPAWYSDDGTIFVACDEKQAHLDAYAHYGRAVKLSRDEDVLDTWFSSALWPFSTLGWPEQTEYLQKFYPTSVLVTGFDIIFFWVARMMMAGLHFIDLKPFDAVYVHALVRDEHGQKMSKTKGNVIDPLNIVDQYGADALRLTLCALAAPGRDIRLSIERVEGYRNFLTKLWNACRFGEMNTISASKILPENLALSANQWITQRFKTTLERSNKAIEEYRFHDLASFIYQFLWSDFCDWYVEFCKINLEENAQNIEETKQTYGFILQNSLRLLHPVAPFITEKLWQDWAQSDTALIVESWPNLSLLKQKTSSYDDIDILIQMITNVRSLRASVSVPAGAKIDFVHPKFNDTTQRVMDRHAKAFCKLARLKNIILQSTPPAQSVGVMINQQLCYLKLESIIDIKSQCARILKNISKLEQDLQKNNAKLLNQNFLDKAPQSVIDEIKTRQLNLKTEISKLNESLEHLSSAT